MKISTCGYGLMVASCVLSLSLGACKSDKAAGSTSAKDSGTAGTSGGTDASTTKDTGAGSADAAVDSGPSAADIKACMDGKPSVPDAECQTCMCKFDPKNTLDCDNGCWNTSHCVYANCQNTSPKNDGFKDDMSCSMGNCSAYWGDAKSIAASAALTPAFTHCSVACANSVWGKPIAKKAAADDGGTSDGGN